MIRFARMTGVLLLASLAVLALALLWAGRQPPLPWETMF